MSIKGPGAAYALAWFPGKLLAKDIMTVYEEREHIDVLISSLTGPSFMALDSRKCSGRTPFPVKAGDARVLGTINAYNYPGAVTAIFDALLSSSSLSAIILLEGLLALVFGPVHKHMKVTPSEQLNQVQQQTVTALAGMDDEMWKKGNLDKLR
ncbi:hypothetical protein BDV27DRAFT_164231 [Aspergillus caelatus]|uniref:Uncharacterized protein n=1 Tax=Aspergillus caelatus TaxID=61420 RepID=A0A5N6ZJV1_9EURO|nr:uncharacterized protein BDV27DRAFT_164231 [Aspergillus caelatus]KAE8357745.1 hypothetical protein BDV27DRAFT_164231 [Aspergillus caelatus]